VGILLLGIIAGGQRIVCWVGGVIAVVGLCVVRRAARFLVKEKL
jgi:hypothetical protein